MQLVSTGFSAPCKLGRGWLNPPLSRYTERGGGAEMPCVFDDDFLHKLSEHFHKLVETSRGDSARGRSLHVLHFLEFAWSKPEIPLNSYRPSRRPAAFLAMVFDLLGDTTRGYTDKLLDGQHSMVRRDIGERLKAPWYSFVGELEEAGFPELAGVLDETLSAALRHPAQSDLPTHLKRLRLYMTPSQLARLDVRMLVNSLSVAQVFAYLRFAVPADRTAREGRHPVGGDLRKVIREEYDTCWRSALGEVGDPDLVTFFAVLPVDIAAFVSAQEQDGVLDDFAVFYACVTDAKAPGRVWQPPTLYVGEGEEAWQHFVFLSARGVQESLSRRAQGLIRLGLSSTFPETFRYLDGWLERPERFPELHTHRPWQEAVTTQRDAIAQARLRFVGRLAHLLKGKR